MSYPIPRTIADDEILVRCVFHHIHYSISKNKLEDECFMPPANEREESLTRRKYSKNDTFCKNHCKTIRMAGQTYIGMCTLKAHQITNAISEIEKGSSEKIDTIPIKVLATPLGTDQKTKIATNIEVSMDTPGLPMHADLIYDQPLIKGETATGHRAVARYLARTAVMYKDPDVASSEWTGDSLT